MHKTALYDCHVAAGAKLVDFAGWQMPIHYGSQLQEHQAVRENLGMFDVSHMQVVDITGNGAKAFLQRVLANDVAKLRQTGRALYSCMLNTHGGVIDDLIVYYLAADTYRLVVNASRRDVDLAWLKTQAAECSVTITPRNDLAIIAIQGPKTYKRLHGILPAALLSEIQHAKPFQFLIHTDYFIARTGYTGEYGYEIILANDHAIALWQALTDAGVTPIGLGARDTLRLEAGLNLYGNDMDEGTSPLVSNLGWTVNFSDERDFIGKQALLAEKAAGLKQKLIGLIVKERGVLRHGQPVYVGDNIVGAITSGSFSPTMQTAIAFARIQSDVQQQCEVELRKCKVSAQIVNLPFVRNGQSLV